MKKTFLLFSLFLSIISTYSQNSSEESEDVQLLEEDEIIDSILEEESEEEFLKSVTELQFLHLSVEYNNKTYFSGRDIGTDQFNISPQITYIHSNGLFIGLAGVYYDKFTPEWDYTSATIGYGKGFGKNKQYRWSVSYDRYFYSDTSENNPFKNALSLGVEIDNKKKTFGTEVSTTYLFGSDNSFQIVSSTYGVLNLIKKKRHNLKLQPQLNVVLAQQTIQLSQTFTIRGMQFTRFVQNNDFGLINTQLQIPLQYSTGNVDFELGYTFNFPTALEGETSLNTTSFFNFSISYLFDL
ncbi:MULTISPECIES: hypothetical protein [unclassified Tenacibaculum]|uniref:hypothetical protein n=1 Tax=unclassified Tenacibaculum TaxID=2635139 RepID=UPI001F1BFC2D|nr:MULTISPECIES: hypothetical protein [unclassified Tenacibaculum]MCF2874485.1 hypothetical protein [Tenacibaculum sp. Cn5-1]MCF2934449.1 hypothetical protein [Tenacibaculum sp. Cn5-34]MCG7510659.1 hypothetical protein [Tenacibaculum sp. Cn5-46]